MTEALERISKDFEDFRQSVEACRSAQSFRPVDWKAAYGALGRVRERFLVEKKNLATEHQAALQKVFEDDVFIKGMMELRQISEHVVRRPQGPQIWTTANVPVQLTVESSAMAEVGGLCASSSVMRQFGIISAVNERRTWRGKQPFQWAVAKGCYAPKRTRGWTPTLIVPRHGH